MVEPILEMRYSQRGKDRMRGMVRINLFCLDSLGNKRIEKRTFEDDMEITVIVPKLVETYQLLEV